MPKCSAAKFLDESNDVDELHAELFARKALGRDMDEQVQHRRPKRPKHLELLRELEWSRPAYFSIVLEPTCGGELVFEEHVLNVNRLRSVFFADFSDL